MGWLSSIFKKKPIEVKPRLSYSELIPTLKIKETKIIEVKLICEKYKTLFSIYERVSIKTGVPSDLIFALHYREASCSFKGVLHNGERIIGTGEKTSLVPKNRGPFNTWEDAAIDALLLKKNIFPESWTFENKLSFAEKFNGLGYRNKGLQSPYVFSFTNAYEKGKYVADGKFNPEFIDKQCGVAAILLELD